MNNIEEDIRTVEDNLFNIQKDTCLQLRISIENILDAYKKNQNIIDKSNILINKIEKILSESYKKEDSNTYRYDELYSDLFNNIKELFGGKI